MANAYYEVTATADDEDILGSSLGGGTPDGIRLLVENVTLFPGGTIDDVGLLNVMGHQSQEGQLQDGVTWAFISLAHVPDDPACLAIAPGSPPESHYWVVAGSGPYRGPKILLESDGVTPTGWATAAFRIQSLGLPEPKSVKVYADIFTADPPVGDPPDGWNAEENLLPPTNLFVQPNMIGVARFELSWTDNNYGQASHEIQRREFPNGAFASVGTFGSDANWSDADVSKYKQYEYRVRAAAEDQLSDWSNTFSVGPMITVVSLRFHMADEFGDEGKTEYWHANGDLFLGALTAVHAGDWDTMIDWAEPTGIPAGFASSALAPSVYINEDFSIQVPLTDLPLPIIEVTGIQAVAIFTPNDFAQHWIRFDGEKLGGVLGDEGALPKTYVRTITIQPLDELAEKSLGFIYENTGTSSPSGETTAKLYALYIDVNVIHEITSWSDLSLGPETLPDGVVGEEYSETLTASGGTGGYEFSKTEGLLPDGLSLDPETGEISGTPTIPSLFEFTARVEDSGANTAEREFQITVTQETGTGPTTSGPYIRVVSSYIRATGPVPATTALAAEKVDPDNLIVSTLWSQSAGPEDNAVIAAPASLLTTVSFLSYVPGLYTFQIIGTITGKPSVAADMQILIPERTAPRLS